MSLAIVGDGVLAGLSAEPWSIPGMSSAMVGVGVLPCPPSWLIPGMSPDMANDVETTAISAEASSILGMSPELVDDGVLAGI